MVKINSVSWGKVEIDSFLYNQALIIGEKVLERQEAKLENLFGTTHKIGEWEQEQLLGGNPEIILIAIGWASVLKVSRDFKKKVEKSQVELRLVSTGRVIKEYDQLVRQGKRVNVLIHTTC